MPSNPLVIPESVAVRPPLALEIPMIRTTALVLTAAFLFAACGDEQKQKIEEAGRSVGEKAGAAWAKVKTFTVEQKDEAVKLWDEHKGDLAARYEKVKAKGGELGEDAKKALAARKDDFDAALAKAKDAGKDGWEAARDGVIAAYEAFRAELAKHE